MEKYIKKVKVKYKSVVKSIPCVPHDDTNENLIDLVKHFIPTYGNVVFYTPTGVCLEAGCKPTLGEYIQSQVSKDPTKASLYEKVCLTMKVIDFIRVVKIKYKSDIKELRNVPLMTSNEELVKKASTLFKIQEGDVLLYTPIGGCLEAISGLPTLCSYVQSQTLKVEPKKKKGVYAKVCLVMEVKVHEHFEEDDFFDTSSLLNDPVEEKIETEKDENIKHETEETEETEGEDEDVFFEVSFETFRSQTCEILLKKQVNSKSSEKDLFSIPKARLCPNCQAICVYGNKCKHSKCVSCGYWFCFICLRVPKPQSFTSAFSSDFNWGCGNGLTNAYALCPPNDRLPPNMRTNIFPFQEVDHAEYYKTETVRTIKIKRDGTIKSLRYVPLEITNKILVEKASNLFEIREGEVVLYTRTGKVLAKGKNPCIEEYIKFQVSQNEKQKELYKRLCLTMLVKVCGR